MINEVLKTLMDINGVSQQDVANATGIPQTTISGYVLPHKQPGAIARLIKIADHFGVSLDYLVGRSKKGEGYTTRIEKLKPSQIRLIEAMIGEMETQNAEKEIDSASDCEQKPTIYFILAPVANRIKIGYSSNPENRIKSIMTASPHDLDLLGTISGTREDERNLHQRFAHIRKNREWFDATPELIGYIKRVTSV